MLISSLIAACGHPPVSTARILSSGRAPCFIKNSPSSFVNISFVTYKEMHLNKDKIHSISSNLKKLRFHEHGLALYTALPYVVDQQS